MPKIENVNVDHDRLISAFHKRGLTACMVATEMGRSKTYFTKCKVTGQITVVTAKTLKSMFNIDRDEYEAKEPQEEVQEATPQAQAIDYDRLEDMFKRFLEQFENAVYRATYSAVKQAWMDE